ncbi:MAG: aldo/keto reductase [Calditrichia bacterium]
MHKFLNVKLTQEGPVFSRIIHGFWRLLDWNLSIPEARYFINELVDSGITTFDHADIYGDYRCEEVFGEMFSNAGIPREKVQLVTKCGIKLISANRPNHRIKYYDTSFQHIVESVNRSLQNLRTDYLDVLLIHRPDPLMDADEVAKAFDHLKQSGKVRFFGVSNFSQNQMELLQSRLSFPLVTNQIEYSLLNLDAQKSGLLDYLQKKKIYPMIWSPFAGGRLFHSDDVRIKNLQDVLSNLAIEKDASNDQIILAWILKHPAGLMPILGTGKLERIKSAIKALEIEISREEWFLLLRAVTGQDVP